MTRNLSFLPLLALAYLTGSARADGGKTPAHPSMPDVLHASQPADWRALDADDTVYLDLPGGRVVIELAPRFAPLHVAAIKTLLRAHYFDGLPVERVQDDYVAQWGDPEKRQPIPAGVGSVAPEFDVPLTPDLSFTPLPDGDVYAPEVGFTDGMPAARSLASHRAWLAHCYGMVGVGRDLDLRSGSGTELYAVIGHAPRHLDRNVALVGRVVRGMELLSSLPRGTAEMGFYAKNEVPVRIKTARLETDVPLSERTRLEVLRTTTPTFAALIESRRNRPEEFFAVPAGRIDLCNVPLPVRERR